MSISKQELKEAFDLCDTDGSGTLDVQEVMAVYKALGLDEIEQAEVEKFVESNRTSGKSGLTFLDFTRLALEGNKADTAKGVYEAFRSFDVSNTGFITVEDLRDVADSIKVKITDEELRKMWGYCAENDIGPDGEGRFSFLAWRTVVATVLADPKEQKRAATGTIPPADDGMWAAYEDREQADRDAAIEKEKAEAAELQANSERKAAARNHVKAWNANRVQREAEASVAKEAKWRERQMADAEAREKIESRKAVVRQEQEEQRQGQAAEQRRKAAVDEKVEAKKAASAPAPPAEGDELNGTA